MGSELLGDIRREIDARLLQLRPAVEEYEQLRVAAEAIDDEPQRDATSSGAVDAPVTAMRELGEAAGEARGKGAENGGVARLRQRRAPGGKDRVLREAVLGALEHGSHTVAELVVVTGEGTVSVNRELRRLAAAGLVAKTEREGKLAWSLATGD